MGILFESDGCSRSDTNNRYDSGGLCQGKAMMISTSWNAPLYAFNEMGEFSMGVGLIRFLPILIKSFNF